MPTRSRRAARLDAFADPDFFLRQHLVELALVHGLDGECFGLLGLIVAEVARVAGELAAIELDDAQRDAIEEAPVVRDEKHAARKREQHFLQPFDRRDIEMIGRFVEKEQVGLEHQRPRQRDALLQAS